MNQFTILSQYNDLLPVARRLQLHGFEPQVHLWGETPSRLTYPVITDRLDIHDQGGFGVREWPSYPQGTERLGCWFDGERCQNHHLLVVDVGAWPGGYGPTVQGGCTVVMPQDQDRLAPLAEQLWSSVAEQLKSTSFRGLVQADLLQDPATGDVILGGVLAGWPFLQTHGFLTLLENLPGLLVGEPAQLTGERYVTCVPVSVPPWPIETGETGETGRRADVGAEAAPIRGLTPQDAANFSWHDVEFDHEARTMSVLAGGSGLLGVARGAANTLELSRLMALDRAGRLMVPQKQMRPDVGMRVAGVLAALELRFGLVL